MPAQARLVYEAGSWQIDAGRRELRARGLARLYWENKLAFFSPKGVKVPTAVSVFPDELYQTPRNWAERAYPNLIHYNKVAKGGHFAAWEQPALLTQELRAGFRPLRKPI